MQANISVPGLDAGPRERPGRAAPLLATALLCLAGCAAAPPRQTPPAEDGAFEQVAHRYLDEMLALTPVTATALGDHRFDGELDDLSAEGEARRVALARELRAALDAIHRDRLTRAHQVDAGLLATQLDFVVWQSEELQEWRWNPLRYTDLTGSAIYGLMARDFAPLPERLRNLGRRLDALPRALAQVRTVLDAPRVPRIHAETAVRQNGGLLQLIDTLVVPQLGKLPDADRRTLEAAIARARTAVNQHQLWLEKKLLPAAAGDFRIGAKFYDARLHFALDSTMTREQIRSDAHAELVSARARMYAIARHVLPEGAQLPERPDHETEQRSIAAALELAYAQRPARSAVFETARADYQRALDFVRARDLVTVYDDPLEIIVMPVFQRGVALAYCDAPGPLDRGQKTFFSVAPIPDDWNAAQVDSFLREYNLRSIQDLTVHEAMPGHYLQLMHANRYDSPLRAALASGSFIEGWAVYAEGLMVEQGFMDADPLMQLIQLKWYLRSVANAILDQAVHVDGMSREEAMRLMTQDTFQEEREAAAKWVRVQLTATQLPTYFVGVREHLALRAEVQRRWGKDFSLKRYHDAVLSFGSPPVRYVRELLLDEPIG